MLNKENYYAHSGKSPVKAITLSLLFGFISAIILSFMYAYAIYWIPFVYINFFVTIGFGFITGICSGIGFTMGKGRNNKKAALLGLITGIFAYYISWGAYTFVNFGTFIFLPSSILKVMELGLEEGFWSLRSATVKGVPLAIFWFMEAVIIIGGSLLGAYLKSDMGIFCEKCNDWTSESVYVDQFETVNDYNDLANKLNSQNYSNLIKQTGANMKSMTLKLSHCHKCNDLHTISINEKTTLTNDKGETETKVIEQISNLLISKNSFEKIKSL